MVEARPRQRPSLRSEADAHFEFALGRVGSFSGQSLGSACSWYEGAGLRANLQCAAAKSAALDYNFQWQQKRQKQQPHQDDERARFNTRFHSYRFVVTMLGGLSVGLMLLLRFNITIAMLSMANQTHLYLEEHPGASLDDFLAEGYAQRGEFNWNNEIVAIILAWYMFGYTLPGPLMARLGARLGCRLAVPVLLATCAAASLLTPAACHLGWQWVVACRLLNGLGASAVVPQLLSLIEKWVRYDEISAGLSVAYLLNASLAALTPLLCGYLTEALHWSWAFYAPALGTLGFCALWLALVADEPRACWLVSERELNYLAADSCEPRACVHDPTDASPAPPSAPNDKQAAQGAADAQWCLVPDSWVRIFQVPSFYAYLALWSGYCSTYSGFLFILPAYLQQFLRAPVSENGFYCFLVQLGCVLAVLWPHQLLRLLSARLAMPMARARLAAYALCCALGALTWLYVAARHQHQLPMLFLNRAAHPGNDVLVTSCLMANYAKAGLSGHAFAIVNTVGNFSIVLSSTLIGWLLDRTGASPAGWSCIFAGLGVCQLAMFAIFAACVHAEPIKFKRRPAAPAATGQDLC